MNNDLQIKIEPDLVIEDSNHLTDSTVPSADNNNDGDCYDNVKSERMVNDAITCCTYIKSDTGKFLPTTTTTTSSELEIKTEPQSNDKKSSNNNNNVEASCEQCGTTFKFKSQIKRHILQVHTLVKPFQCDICKQTFVDKYYTRIHMQTHSGIKPYHCRICNKQFCHAFNIKKHMLVHSGLRPYKCLQCDKTYKHSSHLKRHMDHHNDGLDHWDTRPEGFVPSVKKRRRRKSQNCDDVIIVEDKRGLMQQSNVPVVDIFKDLTDILS